MITIKSPDEIAKMKRGGMILRDILMELAAMSRPGLATSAFDIKARELLEKHGVTSSFLGYSPDFGVDGEAYPSSICISINEEIVHGLPSERVLKEGDIVSLDFGVYSEGFHTDSARTVIVGEGSEEAKELVAVTSAALKEAISAVREGVTTGDVGFAVQKFVESRGMNVVRELVGHGIGKDLHEDPSLPNYGIPGQGTVLKAGMTIALEPMVSLGSPAIKLEDDNWTYSTADGSLSAHFEDTVVVTASGAEIIT